MLPFRQGKRGRGKTAVSMAFEIYVVEQRGRNGLRVFRDGDGLGKGKKLLVAEKPKTPPRASANAQTLSSFRRKTLSLT